MLKHWTEYEGHEPDVKGTKTKFDNTIYTFDIETTTYLILDGEILEGVKYKDLNEKKQERSVAQSLMYIWQFSINDIVYYGRTWKEFIDFMNKVNEFVPFRKYVFVHNLSFEFHFLESVLELSNVFARAKHKVIKCECELFNIEFRCSYYMSNASLKEVPRLFGLNIEKKVGDLDYTKIRTPLTNLTETELSYCEYDCLVVYEFIKQELKEYETIKNIPITSTGHVRRELKERTQRNVKYKKKIRLASNTNPIVYNILVDAFQGGYTHANYLYTNKILKNIVSFDFTSSYPYVLVTHRFPSKEFRKCKLTKIEDMVSNFAYLIIIKMKNVKCRYHNNFISASKCHYLKNGRYDNGRIISADELEMTLTDVDLKLFKDAYDFEYEIIESYYSVYNYLPKEFIEFVLEKYIIKTKYKGIEEKELEYLKQKNRFNALFGMSVTNTIRSEIDFKNGEWVEIPMKDDEIIEALQKEKNKGFLSFAFGVWCTAYARNNLIRNIMKLDDFCVYADTDSVKLLPGFDKNVIIEYNNYVKQKIEYVSNLLNIPIENFAPKDIKGEARMLGLFDLDANYLEFATQGAKKYAVVEKVKNEKIKSTDNVIKRGTKYSEVIRITIAGVSKNGSKCLKSLSDFKDNLVFDYDITNKNTIQYNEKQNEVDLIDYEGKKYHATDKTGVALIPAQYTLGKAFDYVELLEDSSSERAIYKGGILIE